MTRIPDVEGNVEHASLRRARVLFLFAILIPVVIGVSVILRAASGPGREPSFAGKRPVPPNLQVDGPYGTGFKVGLEQAARAAPFPVPVPESDDGTGTIAGYFLPFPVDVSRENAAVQAVAIVWSSDLRLYAKRAPASETQAVAAWSQKPVEEPDAGWYLVEVRGHQGLARDGTDDQPNSSLTWIERGLQISLVSPVHSVEQLIVIVGSIQYHD